MSIESAKSFFIRMQIDEEFAQKIAACQDPEEIKVLVYAEGYEFSAQEIKQAIQELSSAPDNTADPKLMH